MEVLRWARGKVVEGGGISKVEVWIFMGLEHETMTRWEGHHVNGMNSCSKRMMCLLPNRLIGTLCFLTQIL